MLHHFLQKYETCQLSSLLCREYWVSRWRLCSTGTPRSSKDLWLYFQMWWPFTCSKRTRIFTHKAYIGKNSRDVKLGFKNNTVFKLSPKLYPFCDYESFARVHDHYLSLDFEGFRSWHYSERFWEQSDENPLLCMSLLFLKHFLEEIVISWHWLWLVNPTSFWWGCMKSSVTGMSVWSWSWMWLWFCWRTVWK